MNAVWRNPSIVSNNDELRARVRTLAPHDQPGPVGPGGEVDELGELDDFGAVTTSAAGVDGWVPAAGRHHHDAVADAVIDVEPEAVFEVAVDAFFGEPMRRSASICTDQHPMLHLGRVVTDVVAGGPFGGELVECVSEHGDVIDRGVRPGVARPQLRA